MKYKDILAKTKSEIFDTLYNLKKEQLGLRIQKSSGQLKDTAVVRRNRRDAARLIMRLSQLNKHEVRSS